MNEPKQIDNKPRKRSTPADITSQIDPSAIRPAPKPMDVGSGLSKKAQFDYDHQMVRGIFRFHEVPGGYNEFFFRKYKEDKVQKYAMFDGQTYEIPQMVADHLNDNCKTPVYNYVRSDQVHVGVPAMGSQGMSSAPEYEVRETKQIDRMSFQIVGPAKGDMPSSSDISNKFIGTTRM